MTPSGIALQSVNPATGKTICSYDAMDNFEVAKLLDKADAAQRIWMKWANPCPRGALKRKSAHGSATTMLTRHRFSLKTNRLKPMPKKVTFIMPRWVSCLP